jgi:hypothetical protein
MVQPKLVTDFDSVKGQRQHCGADAKGTVCATSKPICVFVQRAAAFVGGERHGQFGA